MKLLVFIVALCCNFLFVNAQRNCGTGEYWQSQLDKDPALRTRYSRIENAAKLRPQPSGKKQDAGVADLPVITIPVVIHVLYNTQEQNISDAQIQSQLSVLNKDFRMQNEDAAQIPAAFAPFAADCQVQFALAKSDPEGRPTTGIIRKKTGHTSWQQDDKMKFSASGGSDVWDSRYYLNIWICSLTKSLLGYSTFPGAAPEKDGVVIRTDVFGTMGKHGSAYNKGRTTTHEIGHWLNLKHLWGDTDCGDDGVDDTPPQKTYNSGCPSFPQTSTNSCNPLSSGDMFMNFMDFSDDACLHMFTAGQMQRIHGLFAASGPRESLLYSTGLNAPWNPSTAVADPQTGTGSSFTVFPNPATAIITLQRNDQKLLIRNAYTIYNTMGRPVAEGLNTGNAISVKELAGGVYFIKLMQGEETLITKFVKQ